MRFRVKPMVLMTTSLQSLLDSAITLTASSTITDGDGDTASDSETVNIGANISFADDGPVLTNACGQQLGHIG